MSCETQICTLLAILDEPIGDYDPIHDCGSAALLTLHNGRPEVAMDLAHEMIHAVPFQDVGPGWLRLFEDATLRVCRDAIMPYALRSADNSVAVVGQKRKRVPEAHDIERTPGGAEHDRTSRPRLTPWVDALVEKLDQIVMLTGAPRHRQIIDRIFSILTKALESESQLDPELPSRFTIASTLPKAVRTSSVPVLSLAHPGGLHAAFQKHLDTCGGPVIIKHALEDWPALHAWRDPRILLTRTLHGLRRVPVELGRSYTDDDWSQEIMPFKKFMDDYLLPSVPSRTGYLAQHDLLDQIPALSNDTITPDLCFATAPRHTPPNITDPPAELEEPIRNSWLGPAGTTTPLHHDPYHNIYCQVIGAKYVRLYAPELSDHLYPHGTTETGISMENTSRVDMAEVKALYPTDLLQGGASASEKEEEQRRSFVRRWPRFKDKPFMEVVLEAGDILYMPPGWWHYVESLEVSFNVSYWFN